MSTLRVSYPYGSISLNLTLKLRNQGLKIPSWYGIYARSAVNLKKRMDCSIDALVDFVRKMITSLKKIAKLFWLCVSGARRVRRRGLATSRMDQHLQKRCVPCVPGGGRARVVRSPGPTLIQHEHISMAGTGKWKESPSQDKDPLADRNGPITQCSVSVVHAIGGLRRLGVLSAANRVPSW